MSGSLLQWGVVLQGTAASEQHNKQVLQDSKIEVQCGMLHYT